MLGVSPFPSFSVVIKTGVRQRFHDLSFFQEQEVRMWLLSTRILHKSIKAGLLGAAGAAESESEGEESDRVAVELDWRQPCMLCGRTYPHQHKRAVRTSSLCDGELSD